MTPERIKYLDSVSTREKLLRNEIDASKALIKFLKEIPKSEFDKPEKIFRKSLAQEKYAICAIKHELERGGKTRVKLKTSEPYGGSLDVYECSKCKATFADTDGNYRYCPYCGRRIKE